MSFQYAVSLGDFIALELVARDMLIVPKLPFPFPGDGQMDGWLGGWMDRQIDGSMGGCMERWVDGG